MNTLLAQLPNAQWRIAYENHAPAAEWAKSGRLDIHELPDEIVQNADVYLCGPQGFMSSQRDALLQRGLRAEQLHQETFGSQTS